MCNPFLIKEEKTDESDKSDYPRRLPIASQPLLRPTPRPVRLWPSNWGFGVAKRRGGSPTHERPRPQSRPAHDPRQHALERRAHGDSVVRQLRPLRRRQCRSLARDPDSPRGRQRLRCSQCGGKTISTRPAWHTGTPAPARQTITTNDRQCPRPATATASPAGFDAGPGLSHGDRGGLRRLRTQRLKVSGFRRPMGR